MGEVISICCRRFDDEAESTVEILRLISALIRNMGRIVDHDIKRTVLERHVAVIADYVRIKLRIDVQTDDFPFAALPESAGIYRGIKDCPGALSRIKAQHLFQQLGVGSEPNRG